VGPTRGGRFSNRTHGGRSVGSGGAGGGGRAAAGPPRGPQRGKRRGGKKGQLGRARGGGWAKREEKGKEEKKNVFLFLKPIF
jgi:hypothetical protein